MRPVNGVLRAVFALCTWASLEACGEDVGGQRPGIDTRDVVDAELVAGVDTFVDIDDASTDALASEAEPPPRLGRRTTLTDGRVIEGELVAIYDHAAWWVDPSATRTFALFDPTYFAPWPDDRSLVFVDEADVATDEPIVLPFERPSYRDFLAEQGIGVARVPIGAPALVVTAHEDHHLAENGYGDFAWDLVLTDEHGTRVYGDGTALDDYLSWQAPVVAPAPGVVVELERDAPDIPPGALPEDGLAAIENLVGIRVDGAFHLYVLHLRQRTIPDTLALGGVVAAGTYLGQVGNSGTTLEPHVHVVMLYWDFERARFWSVPTEMFDVWIAPAPRDAIHHVRADPGRGDFVSSIPF